MPATTGRHLHSCPDCRLAFDSRQALRRHDALDHRPAPDGVWLTAQLIGTSPSSDELPPNVTGSGLAQLTDEAPSTPAGQPTTTGRPIRVPWVAVLALAAALTVLTVPMSPLAAMTLLVLAWGCTARSQLRTSAYRSEPHDRQRRPYS